MKKVLFLSFLLQFSLFGSVTIVSAQGMCNQRCDVNEDCGQGYRCYVGVCRADNCPASTSCSCGGVTQNTVAKPTATPKTTASPRASVSPTPKSTASPSSSLKETPKTGFGTWTIAFLAIALFAGGILLSGGSFLAKSGNLSPQEIVDKRNALQNR